MYNQSLFFRKNLKNIRIFNLKVIIFTVLKIAAYCIGMFIKVVKMQHDNPNVIRMFLR